MKYWVYFSLIPLHKVNIHLEAELTYFIPLVSDSSRQVCEREPEAACRTPTIHRAWSPSTDAD